MGEPLEHGVHENGDGDAVVEVLRDPDVSSCEDIRARQSTTQVWNDAEICEVGSSPISMMWC